MRDKQGIDPELVIREGEAMDQIMSYINEDAEIGVLVLGAGTDKKGPGPLVTQMSRNAGALPIPVTIVPGDLSKEKLEAITRPATTVRRACPLQTEFQAKGRRPTRCPTE